MRVVAIVLLLVYMISPETAFGKKAEESSGGTSSKEIDFEGEVVEGVNKQPLDSLNQISEDEARKQRHLYRKRSSFKDENQESVREITETY